MAINKTLNTKVIIAGAGPVGSMLAIVLSRAGYQVELFESRQDPRTHNPYIGKSSSITLSTRAWAALEHIGLSKAVRDLATPFNKRLLHQHNGELVEEVLGSDNQTLWSIPRAKLSDLLLNQAAIEDNTQLHFEQRLTHLDFISGCTSFSYLKAGKRGHKEVDADYIFAADGAFSKIRRLAQETPRFSYSQHYLKQNYIELTIPPNADGTAKLDSNISHQWPREGLLLTALPNSDNSFTCTLYLNDEGEPSFSTLKDSKAIQAFFELYFSDVFPLLLDPIENFMQKTANPVFLVSVSPWVINNKVVLIGDAAHAMAPFYGQGLHCSFEDCHDLSKLIEEYHGDLTTALPLYYQKRKINADAISKLSKDYFTDFRHYQYNSDEVLAKKIIDRFKVMRPKLWPSVEEIIYFSPDIPYVDVREISRHQKNIIAEIMKTPDLENIWGDDCIYQKIEQRVLINICPLLKITG